ncbi:flavodoxin family protein [Parvularcula sp. ZS-1/3]|uniref:Flavodoxin family protein n=1 Tax=Parvularcula mediterranea TaxID=2732508 RepID=A0A7Y3RNQ5_9PROT|nr:flavodoxin family protein [Parvularcula mediterranea]
MADFSGLKALFLNTTLKRSPGESHTERLMRNAMAIMEGEGVETEILRPVDDAIAIGVSPDMRSEGWDEDAWPELYWPKIQAADILVLGTPLWLGEESSVCRIVIERLYAHSGQRNDRGQYVFYGKVGSCMVTGNEDGVKHASMSLLWALQHIGYAIPPQAESGWIGEVGPGKSYGDDGVGLDNDFTRRTTTFMAWNLMSLAKMLKDQGGFPTHGNNVKAWEDGENFGHPPVPKVRRGFTLPGRKKS